MEIKRAVAHMPRQQKNDGNGKETKRRIRTSVPRDLGKFRLSYFFGFLGGGFDDFFLEISPILDDGFVDVPMIGCW